MTRIFIDGKAGTTGLKIFSRFQNRPELELIQIDEDKRKDPAERAKCINDSDITFLCLPDPAAIEAAALVTNPKVKLIDTSTAHRTLPDWAYGFPELAPAFREKIASSNRIAVPGCYASGFNALVYPLVSGGILPADYPIVCYAMSGYSGAGNKGIAQYEAADRDPELDSPRQYALTQQHKHLKEMGAISRLARTPIFAPQICDYPCGMTVSVPLFADLLKKRMTPADMQAFYAEHYGDSRVVKESFLNRTDRRRRHSFQTAPPGDGVSVHPRSDTLPWYADKNTFWDPPNSPPQPGRTAGSYPT